MAQHYRPDEERSLSRTFFVLSLMLVIASLYTVIDETIVRRPWKHYQATFYALEYDQLRAELQAKEEALLPAQGELRGQDTASEGRARKQRPVPSERVKSLTGCETAWLICYRNSSSPKAAWTLNITSTRKLNTRAIWAQRHVTRTGSNSLSSRSPPWKPRSPSSEPVSMRCRPKSRPPKHRSTSLKRSGASGYRTINAYASAWMTSCGRYCRVSEWPSRLRFTRSSSPG